MIPLNSFIRLAQHTTMMLLHQLHNPDAALFLTTCSACYHQITHGIIRKCQVCPMYDLCPECYTAIIINTPADKKFHHDKEHDFGHVDVDELRRRNTPEAKKEEARRQAGYRKLVDHSHKCKGCQSVNCKKFKVTVEHSKACKSRFTGICQTCNMVKQLISAHSAKCADDSCEVFWCEELKEKKKREQAIQQMFNDRRRQQQVSERSERAAA